MTTIDDQLRRSDPARGIPADLGHSPRARAALARLTAIEPGTQPSPVAVRPRRRAVRYALAAAVVSAGATVVPVLGTNDAAFADWDATPVPVTAEKATHYAQECARWTHVPLGPGPRAYQAKVVEARGTWVMTYLASSDAEAQCLRSTEPSPDFVDGENENSFGPLAETPAADGLVTAGVLETSDGVVSTRQFLVAGKVGAEVTGVSFAAQGVHVQATVHDGTFTAWWPQRQPATLLGRVLENTGYNGSPNPEVTITLRDGRTITGHVKDYDVNH